MIPLNMDGVSRWIHELLQLWGFKKAEIKKKGSQNQNFNLSPSGPEVAVKLEPSGW